MPAISSSLPGLHSAESQLDTAARRIASQGPSVEDSVSLITARQDFAANLRVAHTADEMDRYAIDMYS